MAATVKVLNPARRRGRRRRGNPAQLSLINGGRKMAVRRRRRVGVRRRRATPRANPRRRRRTNTYSLMNSRRRTRTYRRRRNGTLLAGRRRNRRYTRRRRNPSIGGVVSGALWASAGAIATDVLQGFIPFSWGGVWGKIGFRLGAAWGVGFLAQKSGMITAQNAQLMAIGGAVGAAQDAFRLLVGQVSGILAPAPAPQPTQIMTSDGVGDIVYAPAGYDQLGDITYGPQGAGLYS